jgi:protein-S-isoprenylcysteine O-methyltransferase Ste14
LCPIPSDRQYHRGVLVIFWLSIGAWIALEAGLVQRDRRDGGFDRTADRGSGPFLVSFIAAAIVADLLLARSGNMPRLHGGAVFAAGIACIWAGLALRLWAVMTLGRFFRLVVLVQSGHRVIRSGPYRVLRHPAYSGTMLTMIGLGLCLDSWLGLALCVLVPLVGYARRISVEEATLRDRLGPDYIEYSRTTRRLVPLLW